SFQFVRTSLLGVKCEKPKFSEHLDGLMGVAILVRVSNKARVLVLLRSWESVRGTLAPKAVPRLGKAYQTGRPVGLPAKGDSTIHALQPSPVLKLASP
ncbi:MAG: hypothetical protein QOH31_680, partial [Verrucomicrobiota bacterium]